MEGEGASVEAKPGFSLNSRLLSVIAIVILFLVSFFLWTLPFQQNSLPFGEGDSAWHFAIGDHITSSDHASFRFPYYVGVWYYSFNKILGPFAPEYPPSSHANYALMQIFGGERFTPVLIYRAIASFLGVFAVFFLVSRLFGTLPAFIAGLALTFSLREQMTYLFGQQPTLLAILITPVTMYAWYRYLTSWYENDDNQNEANKKSRGNNTYLFVSFALLASQYLLHLQGFAASAILMAVFAFAMIVRFRKLPVSKSSIVPLAISIILFLVVAAPFAAIYLGAGDSGLKRGGLGRLFEWGISPNYVQGSFPPSYVLFSAEYPKVLLPFLFAGMLLLLVRIFLVKKNTREIFLLSWLAGTYIVLHLDVLSPTALNRLARMLVLENYLFFTLIALSVVWLPQMVGSLVKLDKRIVSAAKYTLACILVFALITTSGRSTYDSLKQAYGSIDRITPAQADFSANYLSKLPEKAYVYDPSIKIVGQWRYAKMRWMLAISGRHVGRYDGGPIANADLFDKNAIYFMFDYSDIAIFSSNPNYQQQAASWASQLQQVEKTLFPDAKPLYDVNNIRLYKYEMNSQNQQNSSEAVP